MVISYLGAEMKYDDLPPEGGDFWAEGSNFKDFGATAPKTAGSGIYTIRREADDLTQFAVGDKPASWPLDAPPDPTAYTRYRRRAVDGTMSGLEWYPVSRT